MKYVVSMFAEDSDVPIAVSEKMTLAVGDSSAVVPGVVFQNEHDFIKGVSRMIQHATGEKLKPLVTPKDVVDLLNYIRITDPAACEALMSARVPANDELCTHASIQTAEAFTEAGQPKPIAVVGLLGVLNGLFGTNEDLDVQPEGTGLGPFHGWGAVIMRSDPDAQPKIVEFVTLEDYVNEINAAHVLHVVSTTTPGAPAAE